MKKETNKKSKLWLWILIAVLGLAIIGGVVAAFVLPGLFQQQGPTGPVAEAKLYWNLDRTLWLEAETNMSAREKAEDGYFHIRYAFDGKVEELKITDDKRLVNYLDSQDLTCLAFDENGIVVDCAPASTYFTPAAKELYTKRVQGNILQLNSSMAMNGMDMEFDISGIPVYEVSEGSEEKGSLITPQWLDVVTVYNDLEGNPYSAYVSGHKAINAEVGWRVEHGMYNASTGYKRVPDKDGVYTIPFAINGEIVNRYVKNYDVAVAIENQSMYAACLALEYDEEGYIINFENPAMALQGTRLCQMFNVDSVTEDGFVTATRYMSGNNQGESVTFTYDETCEIYQVCIGGCYEKHCGERIDSLQEGDLINVFTDLDGKPILIYVAIRTVNSPAYYNLTRMYNGTLMATTRVPNEDGYYVFKMAVNGGVKEVRTKSKEIATAIDSDVSQVVGLKLNGSVVKKVYGIPCVTGRSVGFSGRYVTNYSYPIISIAASTDITNVRNDVIADGCKIYTVDENYGVKRGTKSDIKVGDRVMGLHNVRGELCYIFVQQRYKSGFKIGYNMMRRYNTTLCESTRVPNAEGYYVYDVAYNGKVVQFKTKNKTMADFIDLQNAPVFGFKEKNGILTDVCTAASAVPFGQKANSYHYVESLDDGVMTTWTVSNGVKTLSAAQWKMTSKTKVYNVSKNFADHLGEKSKVKINDKVQNIVNTSTGEIVCTYIMNRPRASSIYWHVSRVAPKYLGGLPAGSNRVPDEDGYYVIDLFVDGKIKQFKTKDEMIAADVDTYTQGFGLVLKDGTNIIERTLPAADTTHPSTPIGMADVVSVKNNTIIAKRMRLTSSNYGAEQTATIDKNTKIYNVSPYAEKWGADKLQKGDRIIVYAGFDNIADYVFIANSAEREKGSWGHCKHCGKTVFWAAYTETLLADGHYYLPADYDRTSSIIFGSTTDNVVYDQVFDLNGHSIKCSTSVFTVNDKLTILDSVGGGKVTNGKGVSANGSKQGGNVYVGEGGTFTLLSGTIADGAVGLSGVGSNISAYNGTVNIKGGTISGGIGYLGTAVYHSGTKGGINISGGKLAGSVFAEESKKITLSGAPVIEKLIVSSGTVVKLGALKKGAKITVKGDGIFTTESDDIKSLKSYFVPANSKDTITISGKALKYNNLSGEQVIPEPESPNKPLKLDKNGVGFCVLCGEDVQWTALHEGDVIGDMNPDHPEYNAEIFGGTQNHFHYYVAEDMTAGDADFLYSWQGKSVCLHLNGKTLNIRGAIYCGNSTTINIYGLGKVNCLGNATKSYVVGNMFFVYTSNVNIYGGEYTSNVKLIYGAGAAAKISISDEAVINGIVKMDNGNATISGGVNIKRITLGETAKLTVSKLFKGEASLSVAAGLEEGNLIPEANAVALGKFTGKLTYADFRDIVYTNGRLKVVGEAPSPNDALDLDANGIGICYVCGAKVQWTALHGGDKIGDVYSDGQTLHYYVAEDMTAADGDFQFLRDKSANAAAKSPVTICVHLNGKILNVKGMIESGHGCTTNFMGNGVVLNSGTKELFQSYTANLNLYGGEYYGGDHPVYNPLTEAAKLNVTGDAKLYGTVNLPMSTLTLRENSRIDNISLTNTVVQKDTDGDSVMENVTVYGKIIVASGWAGKAQMTVDAANMDGKLIKADSGVALGDFTGVLINQTGKKFINSDGMLKLTSKTGSIPAAPAAPEIPVVATPPIPEGINDNLVLDSENKAMCVHCGEEVVWTPVANGENIGTVAATGSKLHYYLTEDNTSDGKFLVNAEGTGSDTICLHLNGHNLDTKGGFTLMYASKFNLMGNGNVTCTEGGVLFGVWTSVVNIYGGNYTSNIAIQTATRNSVASILGDTNMNGLVNITAGRTYFAHNASASTLAVSGTGKLQLANDWNGTMEISVADDLMEGNLVKKSAVEIMGNVNGTITHAKGAVTIVDRQLCITLPVPKTPVWGVFDPDACGGLAYCEHCGEAAGAQTWTAWGNGTKPISSGNHHLYLSGDLQNSGSTLTLDVSGSSNVCLNLNGHNITSSTMLRARSTGTLAIMGDGNVTMTGTDATYSTATIRVASGGLYLYGGTYSVSGEAATAGKPVISASNKVFIKNATVDGAIATGSVYAVITLEETAVAKDIRVTTGKVIIAAGWSGTMGLTVPEADIANNLISASRVEVKGDFTGTITMADGRTATKEGNQLKIVGTGTLPSEPQWGVFDPEACGGLAYCEHCGEAAGAQTWTAWGRGTKAIGSGSNHFYLSGDLEYSGTTSTLDVFGDSNVCLNLNGHNITSSTMLRVRDTGTLAIMGEGNVTRTGSDANGTIRVASGGLYLYGGTYSVAEGNPVISASNKVFIKNATVDGAIVADRVAAVITLEETAVAKDIRVTTGKVIIAAGWSGTMGLTVPEADIANNLISASRVEVKGDFTGTITMADGKTAIKEGNQLKIVGTGTPPSEPQWGTFDPWNFGGRAYCEHCGEAAGAQTWTAWESGTKPISSGSNHFYLSGDLENSGTTYTLDVYGDSNVCLNLNGHNITSNTMLRVRDTGTLAIMGEGNVTRTGSDANGTIRVASGGLYLYGGTYSGPGNANSPVISAANKVFIKNATVDGAIVADRVAAVITLEETAVAKDIRVTTGKVIIAAGWSGTMGLTVPEADIANNLISASRVEVKGDFTGTITMADGKTAIKEGNQLKIVGTGTPPSEPQWGTFDPWNFGGRAYCEHCGEAAGAQTWTAWESGTKPISSGSNHFYLSGDLENSGTTYTLDVYGDSNVCLNLNGHNITSNTMLRARSTGTLAIMGEGNVTRTGSDANGTIRVASGGLYLYGGTYSVAEGNPVISASNKVFIKNATVDGAIATGSVYAVITLDGTAVAKDIQIPASGKGKVLVAAGWSGTAKLTAPEGTFADGVLAAAVGAAKGDFTGTLTLSTGEALINDNGSLKVGRTDPVWGTFDPWNYGGRAYCEACGQEAGIKTWKVYNGEYATTSLSEDGVTHHHFYLDKDVTYETEKFLQSDENICFHLNGKKLTAGANSSHAFFTKERLCIMGDGIVTGGSHTGKDLGSIFQVNSAGAAATLEIYGGTYKKPATSTNPMIFMGACGGKIYIYGGTFDVNGSSPAGERGNLIYIQGKTSGAYSGRGIVEIYGGTFIGDSRIGAAKSDTEYVGASSLKVLGGNYNGKIAVTNACEATLGGNAVVKEISVTADSKLTVKSDFAGKAAVSFESALVDNKVPAANGMAEGAFNGFLSLTDGRALVADGTMLKVPANANLLKDLEFTSGTMAVCPLCNGEPVQWTDVTKNANKQIGYQSNKGHLHLYLSEDMIGSETLQFADFNDGTVACFHLNGHNLTLSSRFIVSAGTVNILGRGNVTYEGDCVTNSATNQEEYNSVGFEVDTNGTLNVYGGHYILAGAALEAGKPMMKTSAATSALNLFDVSVSGAVQADAGNTTLDASALINQISVTTNGKLNVAGTFTGAAVVNFATGLVEDAVPAANGSSTGAFTGSVTLANGTVLIGDNGKLIKKPANS